MLKSSLRKAAFWLAHKHGKPSFFYRRVIKPTSLEHAEFLRRHAGFYAIGENCSIQLHAVITDPPLTRLGNNVRLAGCKLIAHDGSINMLNRAFGLQLDSIGVIDVGDDVFIGEDAMVLGGVHIGSRCIVAAGALVTKDVESGWVVGGVPARPICRIEDHVARLQARSARWPWMSLVEQREGDLDFRFEAQLTSLRQAFFFGEEEQPAPYGAQPPGSIIARCTQTGSQELLQQNGSAMHTLA